ncbi:MAG: formyl-CoA transferase [SAR116 cluster bacterium]|nr:formyl-CoA transferase [SAR116 cluster bacterium]RPH11119.1 MAG: CoA transferase [Alphaproteobacteria bacterium TMED54]
MPHIFASEALSHITVLDLTRVRSGPTAVRQLADWGANVIKIEPPESVEPDGSLGASRDTADFQNLHRNKRSLTLNLKEEKAIEIFYKLVKKSDVVVENFRPDVKDRLGISYNKLKEINPRIILASISGFGQDGPYGKRPGFDQIAQGMGGLMSITGAPGEGPMRVGVPIADLTAGLFCAMGIQTALIEREKSGKGQWVTTSLLQAQIFMLDFQAARWLCEKTVPKQAGNNHPTSVPTGVFKTSNGAINLAVAGETIWKRFAEAVNKKEWLEMPEFSSAKARLENRDYLNGLIEEVTSKKTSEEWVDELEKVGCPCGPIYSIDEVFNDPQVKHLNMAKEINTDPFGETHLVNQPFNLNRTPNEFKQKPPKKGEHSKEILNELGIKDEELISLEQQNII